MHHGVNFFASAIGFSFRLRAHVVSTLPVIDIIGTMSSLTRVLRADSFVIYVCRFRISVSLGRLIISIGDVDTLSVIENF